MIEAFIDKLIDLDIRIELIAKDKLKIHGGSNKVPVNILAEIKNRKDDLVHYLSTHYAVAGFGEIPQVPLQESYVLSATQRRLWFLSQFEESNIAYNLPRAYVFEGALDPAALHFAFDTLIERHEILRTVFREDEQGAIRQFILPRAATGFCIDYHDLQQEKEQDVKVGELVHATFTQPFDFVSGPLLRAGLYQVAAHKWIFTYVMHHIISDAWSMGILFREVLMLYNAGASRAADPLPPLRIQYKDYAAWQQEQLSDTAVEAHKHYWLTQFAGERPVLELPADKIRPAVKTYNSGAVISKRLDQQLADGIKSISQEAGGTLFMGLLAAVNALFYRYTQQEDITIGTPIAGRDHADVEDQIGFYVNTLALRTRFNGNGSYKDLLQQVKEVALDAYEHQVYPFDELVDELRLQRDMSRNPLFDIQVIVDNAEISHKKALPTLGKLSVSPYEEINNTGSVFDMVLHFTETGDGLQADIVYNNDVFTESNLWQLLTHLKQLLGAIITDPDKPLNQLSYLGETEEEQLLLSFNNTACPYPKDQTLVSLFEAQAARTPDHTAVVFEDNILTYRELDEQSNQLAVYLRSSGHARTDALIGLMMDRSAQLLICILGILKAGAAYVPIDPAYPKARKSFILKDAGITLLLTQTAYIFDLDYYQGDIFSADVQLVTLDKATGPCGVSVQPQQLAYVIYTSGSTGTPKGVMIEHGAAVNTMMAQQTIFSLQEGENALQFASPSFDASVWEIFLALTVGASLYIIDEETKRDPLLLAQYITGNKIDIATLPPSYVRLMQIDGIRTLKHLVTAGEAAIREKGAAFSTQGNFYNAYGPTETSICAAVFRLEKEDEGTGPVPIGKPIPNVQLYITDDHNNLLPIGVTGEICIGGAGLARGYLNNPALTAQKFVPHPFKPGEKLYRTGDLGRWLPDGNMVFTGRKDHQIKTGGFRVELGEIENALQLHPYIDAALVTTRSGRTGETELVAYVISKESGDISGIRAYLAETLPAYMLPHHFVELDAWPLTHNGKINRTKLPDPEDIKAPAGVAYVPPQHDTEIKMVQIWEEILGKEKVGIRDDYFELGGSSLKAMMLVKKVKDEMGAALSLKALFEHRTIENVAKYIDVPDVLSDIISYDVDPQAENELSYNQLIYFSEWNKGDTLIITSYQIEHLELTAFQQAIHQLIARHDILRTVFIRTGDTIRQQVLPVTACRFEVNESRRVFDLSVWPLFDVNISETPHNGRTVVVTMHHILTDGYSGEIMKNELRSLYNAILQKKTVAPAPLPFQYTHFVRWQRNFLRSATGAAHQAYWLRKLQGCTPAITLPAATATSRQLRKVSTTITGNFFEDIDRFAKENGLTRTSLLLGVLTLLISQRSDQEDITIVTSVAGRNSKYYGELDVSGLIGFFSNLILVRNRIDKAQPVPEYLQTVQRNFLDDLSYDAYPIEKLIHELPEVNPAAFLDSAVFFNYHHTNAEEAMGNPETSVEEEVLHPDTPAQFAFGLIVREFKNGLQLEFMCNSQALTDMEILYCHRLQQIINTTIIKL